MEEFELWMVPVELKGYYICFDHMKRLSKIDFFFMSDRIRNKFMFACNMHRSEERRVGKECVP